MAWLNTLTMIFKECYCCLGHPQEWKQQIWTQSLQSSSNRGSARPVPKAAPKKSRSRHSSRNPPPSFHHLPAYLGIPWSDRYAYHQALDGVMLRLLPLVQLQDHFMDALDLTAASAKTKIHLWSEYIFQGEIFPLLKGVFSSAHINH